MIPADQGLGADQFVMIELRLIEELKLIQPNRLSEVFFKRGAGVDGDLQGRGKESNCVPARGLGLIHCDIGLLQNAIGIVFLFAKQSDPNAATANRFVAFNQKELVEGLDYLLSDALQLRRSLLSIFAQVMKNHDKLVSGEAAHSIAFADARNKASRHFLK